MGVFAGRGGAAKPTDYTSIKHSFAEAAGGATSAANDLVTWMSALLGGRVLNAEYQKKWLDSIQPEDPAKPDGAKYGYGIAQFSWAGNTVTHSRGETPGYNSHMGVETANQMTLVIWCNQPVTTNLLATANSMMIEVLDQIYVQSPKVAPPTATPTS